MFLVLCACGMLSARMSLPPVSSSAAADPAVAEKQVMRLHQVEVGCANCHLLTAGDTVILIDGGTNRYKPSSAPAYQIETGNTPDRMMEYIAASGIDHIDAHFVTHYHNDHAQQLPVFSRLYGRDGTVVYGPSERLPDYLLPLPRGTYLCLRDGMSLDVGPFHVDCVGPAEVRRDGEINEDSLNLLITYGSFRMLFTGDYMSDEVMREHGDLVRGTDVFVFPHHGLEPYAVTTGTMLDMNAGMVLIPGDPEGRVRIKYLRLGLRPEIYGNLRGNIVIESDGTEYAVHEHAEPGQFAE